MRVIQGSSSQRQFVLDLAFPVLPTESIRTQASSTQDNRFFRPIIALREPGSGNGPSDHPNLDLHYFTHYWIVKS